MEQIGSIFLQEYSTAEKLLQETACWFGRTIVWLIEELSAIVIRIKMLALEFFEFLYNMLCDKRPLIQSKANIAENLPVPLIRTELDILENLPAPLLKNIIYPDLAFHVVHELFRKEFVRNTKMISSAAEVELRKFGKVLSALDTKQIWYEFKSHQIVKIISFFPVLERLELGRYELDPSVMKEISKLLPQLKSLEAVVTATQERLAALGDFQHLTSLTLTLLQNCPHCIQAGFLAPGFVGCGEINGEGHIESLKTLQNLENLSIVGKLSGVTVSQLKLFPNLKRVSLTYSKAIRTSPFLNPPQQNTNPFDIKVLAAISDLASAHFHNFANLICESDIGKLRKMRPSLSLEITNLF